MASITAGFGFETGSLWTETDGTLVGAGPTGTCSASTTQKRSGSYALRCNPASGATGYWRSGNSSSGYQGFGFYIATLPSVSRVVVGSIAASTLNLRLDPAGTISVYNNTTLIGTSSTTLATNTWYWLSTRQATMTGGTYLTVNGVAEVTGTSTLSGGLDSFGCSGTEASAIDFYFDDIIVDGSGHQGTNIHVLNALPISDNTNSNWRKGGGTTTGTDFWEAVNNVPPAGLASASETDTTNVESAWSTGTANYVANMQSYTTIGLAASDTVYMVRSVLRHGEDISTGTKTGTVQITANPAEGAATAMNFGASSEDIARPLLIILALADMAGHLYNNAFTLWSNEDSTRRAEALRQRTTLVQGEPGPRLPPNSFGSFNAQQVIKRPVVLAVCVND